MPRSNLPKRTKSQRFGEIAADTFSTTFTKFCNVIPVPQSRDLGIDFICEVMNDEEPTGLSFSAQCKGRNETGRKNFSLSVNISVTTINYWLLQRSPTFLFVYTPKTKSFFWCFPLTHVASLDGTWKTKPSISIPANALNRFSQNVTEIPPNLLAAIKAEDAHQKINDLRDELYEMQGEYESKLEYETVGRYEEYQAEIALEEWKIERHSHD